MHVYLHPGQAGKYDARIVNVEAAPAALPVDQEGHK